MTEKRKRRSYTAEFKSKVALEALLGQVTLSELSARYGIHPGLISQWKKSLIVNCHHLFEDSHPEKDGHARQIEALNRELAGLTAEYNFLKNKLTPYL